MVTRDFEAEQIRIAFMSAGEADLTHNQSKSKV
jgi:hypothetical protein